VGGQTRDASPLRADADRARRTRLGRDKAAVAAARLAAELAGHDGPLTTPQREQLAGWSSLAQWIGTDKGAQAAERVEEVWPGYTKTANASILNAYYTDPDVVTAVWTWLTACGVTAGHGFEPGCGRGDWMAGAPRGFSFDAVDIDPVSVTVARLLTGAHVEQCRIEEWDVSRSTRAGIAGYDLIVGNVPFSTIRPAVNNPHRDNLHNLAVARSIDMLRPGGVATLITSRYALDAAASRGWRERLADAADLVAAFRLPAGAHRAAGTDVVTDLLVLRRPLPGEARAPADWLDVVDVDVAGGTFRHNEHFARYPNRVLGRYEPGGAYRAESLNVIADRPAAELLTAAIAAVAVDYQPCGQAPQQARPAAVSSTGRRLPAGSIIIDPTSPTGFSRDGAAHKVTKKGRHQLDALCELRDHVTDYLDAPSDEGRAALADLYANYRTSWPPLNSYTQRAIEPARGDTAEQVGEEVTRFKRRYPAYDGFRSDPSWWSVAALETFDDDTGAGIPAPILQHPVLADSELRWPDRAESLTLAVANSLSRFHLIDQDYIAAQLDIDIDTARGHLASVAFEAPGGGWEIAATYLAGDVVAKLEDAEAAARVDDRYARNVTALRDALPEPLTQAEIVPELGVTWITAEELSQFVADTAGGGQARVLYHPPSGQWSHEGWAPPGPAQYRTDRHSVVEQVVRAANAVPVTVQRTTRIGGAERLVVDAEATASEQLARDNLNEALQTWCWAEPERAARLVERYNRLYNRYQATHFDGSHLTLPGLAADFTARPHQKDVVWRILTSVDSGVLMAHGVGAGKTAAMIIAAHEARRTGRVHGTTLFAVPGNMVEQFARDYLRLYPSARVITPRDSDRDAIREFAARVATGDFDAAICSHHALKSIPLHPDSQRANLQRRLDDLAGADPEATMSRRAARTLERRLAKMREDLAALSNAAEDPTVVYFDRLGVGMLFIDEAHLAKNIALNTSREGLPMPDASQLAEAVLARADLVRSWHGDAAVVMATATPITNSPAEMWVAARLVAPASLSKAGIEHFDGFAANFLTPVESIEYTAGGRLKMVTRLADYRNFPDLARLFRSFCDVRETDSLGFRLPLIDSGQAHVHVTPPSDQQQQVAAWARERANREHLDPEAARTDPVIAIMGVARAAALHPATISADTCARWATRGHPTLEFTWDEPIPKLDLAADTIAAIHHRTAGHTYPDSATPGAAQVVFCDQGTPQPGAAMSVYQVLTDRLVDRGVPRGDIAWVHDWPDPATRQALWNQVRGGQIRVLIGSTMQMGIGVNIQTRLYAAHELTAPYRPDWLTQAEGRLIRQGNHHDRVEIHRYVSERTADANSWQILQRKAHFIRTAMSHPDRLTRDLRDESVQTPAEEFAAIAALATGDQRHMQLAALAATIARLERGQRAHHASAANQQRAITRSEHTLTRIAGEIAAITSLQPQLAGDPGQIGQQLISIPLGDHTVTVDGVTYHTHRDHAQLTLTIPDTTLRLNIDRGRLDPHDGGRGLGTTVLNLHRNLPNHLHGLHTLAEQTRRQRDAELARPITTDYPRAGELADARTQHAELLAILQPHHKPAEAAVAVDDPHAGDPHPIYGHHTPTTAQRHAWAGTYDRYEPTAVVYWGNRAKGANAWAAAVNAFSVEPANQHPSRRHDVGVFHGVTIHARITATTMLLAPRVPGDTTHLPAYETRPGNVDPDQFADWLHRQHQHARIERNALRAAHRTGGAEPAAPAAER
jgi:N12 class adenine-specific DNA methylase